MSIDEWGRQDIAAEAKGQVIHLTQFNFDGPGRRRRPIDQLRDDGVISEQGHAAGERYIDLVTKRVPPMNGSQTDFMPAAPGSRCLTNDERLMAQEDIAAAIATVLEATGRMGLRILLETLSGRSLASIALSRGYVRGLGRGDATRMHSQIRDAYDALGSHFAECDRLASKGR